MGSRDKVVTLAVAGGIALALGVWTNHWWTAEGGAVRIGLRGIKVCGPMLGCFSVSFEMAEQFGAGEAVRGTFFTLAKLTYWIGLLGALLLFGHAYAHSKLDEHRVGWAAAAACIATALLGIATVANKPADLEAGLSWSFPLALIGVALGIGAAIPSLFPSRAVARARGAVAGVADRVHRAAVGPVADLTDPKPPEIPEARVVETGAGTPAASTPDSPPVTARYDDRLSQAKARSAYVAPRGGFMNKKERRALVNKTREVSADAVRDALRFVAHRVEIVEAGLQGTLRNGHQVDVPWSRIERAVMRRLPTDEPYRGLLLLDVVAAGATAPLRLLPTTHVNYGALPGGAGVSSTENFKKLAVHIRERNPNAVLDGSPPSFGTPREFLEYDGRYR